MPASRPSARRNTRSSTQRKADFVKGGQERGLAKEHGGRDLRADRQIRRLRIQQVSHRRLRPGRLPDGVSEDAFHAGVHGRAAVQRDRGRQQARHHGRAHRRRPKLGVEVLPPDINASESSFSVQQRQDRLRPDGHQGRAAGRPTDEIVARRKRGRPVPRPVRLLRAGRSASWCSEAAIEKLIKAGAFDCFRAHRAQLTAVLPRALQAATERQSDRASRPAQPVRRLAAEQRRHVQRSPCDEDAAGRDAVAGDGEAEVREGGARLLLLEPSAGPGGEGDPPVMPRTRSAGLKGVPAEDGGHAGRHADAGSRHDLQEAAAQRQHALWAVQGGGLDGHHRVA